MYPAQHAAIYTRCNSLHSPAPLLHSTSTGCQAFVPGKAPGCTRLSTLRIALPSGTALLLGPTSSPTTPPFRVIFHLAFNDCRLLGLQWLRCHQGGAWRQPASATTVLHPAESLCPPLLAYSTTASMDVYIPSLGKAAAVQEAKERCVCRLFQL